MTDEMSKRIEKGIESAKDSHEQMNEYLTNDDYTLEGFKRYLKLTRRLTDDLNFLTSVLEKMENNTL